MDGADSRPCTGSVRACLKEEMGAFFSRGLEDHAIWIMRINAAVFSDFIRIDYEDVEVVAASSAAQADHAH